MDGTLIKVEIVENGDRAYAETPEAAILAARTMRTDYCNATGSSGSRFHARFTVDGEVVATAPVKSLMLSMGKETS